MILLTSDGITSPQLEEEIKKSLVPISRRAALVTTASCRYKEKDHNVPVLSALMRRLGLSRSAWTWNFRMRLFYWHMMLLF